MQRILQSAEPFPLTAIAQNATAASGASASVIVIGAGLGGLSAAIHLRLAGFDVTVYEANDKVGGRANVIEKQGFRFDTGPSLLNYPWVFQELFAAAGKKLEDYVELLPVDPAVAFQWEDGTHLQLSSNFTKLAEECERLEAGGSVALLSFLQDAGAKYRLAFEKLINRNQDNPLKWLSALSPGELRRLSIWRSLDRELRRFFKSRYLREALGAYGMYLGGSPFDLPGLFTILSYGELAYGLWLPKGGIYGIVEEIARLARELGVKIYTNHPIRQIIVNNSKVTGVLLDNGQIQPTSIVVSNVDWPTTNTKLLAPSYQSKVLRQRVNNYRLTPGVITYYWGVSGKVENIGHHTIFLPNNYRGAFEDLFTNKRIPTDLPFYVSIPSATDPDLAPHGSTAMFVLVPTPLVSELPNENWQEVVTTIKEKVFRRLHSHGVNLTPDRICFEEVYTPAVWAQRFGLYDGSAFGGAHTLLQVGPFRPRNYSTEIGGLYYTGASTTPGTGMPMVILSGKLVAARIQARVGV